MDYVRFTLRMHIPKELWESMDADCRSRGETIGRMLMQEMWDSLDAMAEKVDKSVLTECIWLESQIEEGMEESGRYEKFWETDEDNS